VQKATLDLKARAIFLAVVIIERKCLRWRGKFCAEPVGLKLRAISQIAPTDSSWKAEKVFDQRRGTSLSSGRVTFQNHRIQSFRRRVNRCRKACRTRADNGQVAGNFAFALVR